MPRVLMIDDDVELSAMLKRYLETDTLQFDCVHDGQAALDHLFGPVASRYDLLLLDVMLPGRNGLEVLEEIRGRKLDVPVLMFTAQGEPMDKISGLEGGADDYVCKPCDPRELSARIAAILRRAGGRGGQLGLGDIELDRGSRVVQVAGNAVALTDVEFRLLNVLLRNAGQVVPVASLSSSILEREYESNDRSLNTHVSHLRQKLGAYPDGSARIKASRSRGFMYVLPPQVDR